MQVFISGAIILVMMHIHAIADTHNRHKRFIMPGGDLLIHAGDVSMSGTRDEIFPFLDWYAEQNYAHLILVPGNHDWLFEKQPAMMAHECKGRGIILLNDCGVTVEGIPIWGSPVQPWFHDWAFNRERGKEIRKHWDLIPQETEILITHGPAYGILDFVPEKHCGCQDLLNRIQETEMKLHICGHVHGSKGFVSKFDRLWVNASAVDDAYKPTLNNPMKVFRDRDGHYQV